MKMKPSRAVLAFFAFAAGAWCASACEVVLTHAEIAAPGRVFAVEFFGPTLSALLGSVVNGLGDVNGDGFADIAIAAPNHESAGVVYIVFGRSAAAWSTATFNLSAPDTPDPASWIKIGGDTSAMQLGSGGIASGDFNGDGVSDFLVSAQNLGKVFVVFGRSGAWSSFNISQVESGVVPGFAISDCSTSTFNSVGNAGDLNGDGIEDLLVSDEASPGTAYVVFGVAGATRSTFSVNTIDGTNGFKLIDGTGRFGYGFAMGSVGDVNGDGLADLAIGSYSANNCAGRAYIVFARNVSASGQWPDSIDLSSFLDGMDGFVVEGSAANSYLGYTVVGAGDVNGDGFADVFIGTSTNNAGSWILFGHPVPWISPINASQLDGANGFHFLDSNEFWGRSGGGVGDVNGDGIDDVIIGGTDALGKTGAAAIIFGHNGSWPAEIDCNDTVGSVGFLVEGPSSDSMFGWSARGAGDVNGDGISDFVVGARKINTFSGYAALVFGVADHCAVCSNTTEDCIVCDDGFILNGTVCKEPPTPSSSHFSGSSSTNSDLTSLASSAAASGSTAVVVIETGGGGTAIEVAAEVAQLLGVDVGQISVIEITPGTFEVTVINEEVAQQLVILITQCIEDGSSDLQLMN